MPSELEPPVPAARGTGGRRLLLLVAIPLLAVAGYFGYRHYQPPVDPAATSIAAGDDAKKSGEPGKGDGKSDAKSDDKAKGFGKGDGKGGRGGGGPIPVVAVPARTAPLPVYLTGLGTVTPLRTVTVRSRVDGQLMRVRFEEGQMVKQGQVLAEIDPRPYEVARLQAEGQLARDRALLANAKLDLARYRTLAEQDSIARQQVDSQEALVAQYEGIVQSDQAQLDNAKLQLVYARIQAPISGRAGLRLVDPGNIIRAGDATGIVVITQIAPIAVSFTVPQDNLPTVLARMDEGDVVPVEAWDRDQKTRLATGRLAAIDNLVDTSTGTIKLRARFRNEDGPLFPNQFVNVRMRLSTLEDATVIPSAAVQRGSQGLFVYVVKDDLTVTARPVKLGPADGARVAVSAGIEPGERVVIDGIDRLREGSTVIVTKRPEFKPSVDGTSGARKGGQRRGDGKGGEGKGGAKGGERKGAGAGVDDPAGGDGKGSMRGGAAPAEGKGGERRKGRPEGAEGSESPRGSTAGADDERAERRKGRRAEAGEGPATEGGGPPGERRKGRPEGAGSPAADGEPGERRKGRRQDGDEGGARPSDGGSRPAAEGGQPGEGRKGEGRRRREAGEPGAESDASERRGRGAPPAQ
jgi:multidrug efflux system membrane fusion protein